MASSKDADQELLTLPAGHPQAGYTSHDPSGISGIGQLSDEEQDAYDEQVQAYEDEVAAVAQSDHENAVKAGEVAEDKSEQKTEKTEAPPKTSSKS